MARTEVYRPGELPSTVVITTLRLISYLSSRNNFGLDFCFKSFISSSKSNQLFFDAMMYLFIYVTILSCNPGVLSGTGGTKMKTTRPWSFRREHFSLGFLGST